MSSYGDCAGINNLMVRLSKAERERARLKAEVERLTAKNRAMANEVERDALVAKEED